MKYSKRPSLGLMMSAALSAIGLSACAATAPELEGYADGWRRARVEAVLEQGAAPSAATATTLAHQSLVHLDCRASASNPGEGARFALFSYAFGGNPNLRRHVIAPLPTSGEASQARVGQQLAVQVRQCEPLRALSGR